MLTDLQGVLLAGATLTLLLSGSAAMVYLHSDSHRGRVVARIARRMRFQYRRCAGSMLRAWFNHFPLFRSGRAPSIRHAIKGRFLNADVRVFDFSAFTDRQRTTTVAVFRVHGCRLPRFVLWPREFTAQAELPLESREREVTRKLPPGLTRRYILRAANPRAARCLLQRRSLDFLQTHPGWHIEGGGSWVSVYHYGHRVGAAHVADFCRDAFQVFRAFRLK